MAPDAEKPKTDAETTPPATETKTKLEELRSKFQQNQEKLKKMEASLASLVSRTDLNTEERGEMAELKTEIEKNRLYQNVLEQQIKGEEWDQSVEGAKQATGEFFSNRLKDIDTVTQRTVKAASDSKWGPYLLVGGAAATAAAIAALWKWCSFEEPTEILTVNLTTGRQEVLQHFQDRVKLVHYPNPKTGKADIILSSENKEGEGLIKNYRWNEKEGKWEMQKPGWASWVFWKTMKGLVFLGTGSLVFWAARAGWDKWGAKHEKERCRCWHVSLPPLAPAAMAGVRTARAPTTFCSRYR